LRDPSGGDLERPLGRGPSGVDRRGQFPDDRALAKAARERGIGFLFSSSCSVYGEADGGLTEDGAVNPLTCYAASKVDSERALFEMASRDWRPVVLRYGTLFGYSPRMRFDLVVNIFALYSTLRNEIQVFGDGCSGVRF
jgi:nucleoside-diphosphate-sugar epimerase